MATVNTRWVCARKVFTHAHTSCVFVRRAATLWFVFTYKELPGGFCQLRLSDHPLNFTNDSAWLLGDHPGKVTQLHQLTTKIWEFCGGLCREAIFSYPNPVLKPGFGEQRPATLTQARQ